MVSAPRQRRCTTRNGQKDKLLNRQVTQHLLPLGEGNRTRETYTELIWGAAQSFTTPNIAQLQLADLLQSAPLAPSHAPIPADPVVWSPPSAAAWWHSWLILPFPAELEGRTVHRGAGPTPKHSGKMQLSCKWKAQMKCSSEPILRFFDSDNQKKQTSKWVTRGWLDVMIVKAGEIHTHQIKSNFHSAPGVSQFLHW